MSDIVTVADLHKLVSETRNPRTMDLDRLPVPELLARMNDEDKLVALAVERELPNVALAVDRVVAAFEQGGRLIYIGAGTSGRLGVLDASECPPTFRVPPELVVGLIAGGDTALRNAVENAEDDTAQGAEDLRDVGLTGRDVVVGIAVSGQTPYVVGALAYAREVGAVTVALSCNPGSKIAAMADVAISPVVGPEVLTGSTRLKSGTAQKMVLNMLSTASMIRIGKAYENLMVDVSVSNRKLMTRAIGIVTEATGCDPAQAEAALAASGQDVKLAILMELTGLDREPAEQQLRKSRGFLREAIDETRNTSAQD
ncbi:N-acetylmuramic acid 6-phosphate etherase [Sinisalibacter aestuarii]|uniref:N-acetylmuramic acid 6-phosphate etherase n=1 Tax=Sinisalibacter aestuarii TaxID=2949426 RepID=A0ABQ5LU10_9RHOB|nr:N-acetylmuramic acid 6-phosphate etherase [Sinisalibacter aestuarii]GKY88470.1 N-acetylmuramic acid 6-phosphate etherase 2 [Sinisalibacter aestuarii]